MLLIALNCTANDQEHGGLAMLHAKEGGVEQASAVDTPFQHVTATPAGV